MGERTETVGSFIALGDSFTEGLDDWRPDGTPRGWADRVAENLSERRPGFRSPLDSTVAAHDYRCCFDRSRTRKQIEDEHTSLVLDLGVAEEHGQRIALLRTEPQDRERRTPPDLRRPRSKRKRLDRRSERAELGWRRWSRRMHGYRRRDVAVTSFQGERQLSGA